MTPPAAPPLVELRTDSGRGHVSELRVRPNGRFEGRSGGESWGLISRYTPAELDELRAEMERADAPPLPAVVKAEGTVSHPVRQTWKLQLADGPREVVVEHYKEGQVPRLDRLYLKLFTIPRVVEQESLWRVRVNGEVVRRRVIGEPAFIAVLEPMLAAIYDRPHALEPIGPGTVPQRLLVDVRYVIDGKRGDRVAVTARGRAFLTERGTCKRLRNFTDGELKALRRAIVKTGWPTLPDPITNLAGG